MIAVSPEFAVLVAQVVMLVLIVIPTAMFSYDAGRDIARTNRALPPLLLSGVFLLASSVFAYCVIGLPHAQELIFTAMSNGALAWVIGIIVGFIDDLNGAKLKWLLSAN